MNTISSNQKRDFDYKLDLGQDVSIELPSKDYPLKVIANNTIDPMLWGQEYKKEVNEYLSVYGAILLRGFDIDGAEGFNKLFSVISGEPMKYENRTSPRKQVHNNVYTSTEHPKHQVIHMHTENSYSLTYNRVIAFFCETPPTEGGQTPIADERKLLEYLSEETINKFRAKKIKYLRNSVPGIGLDWRVIYQTDSKEEVNDYLQKNGFEYSWINDEHLRVKWTLSAFQKHPITNEDLWFNHMYFGLKCHYDSLILEYFEEEDLPFATYYGDGTEIEDSVIQEFKNFYDDNAIVFDWEKNDFLLLDNMMFSHGRKPFNGERKILTAMGQPVDFH